MIVECSNCKKKYKVDAAKLGNEKKQFRCRSCRTVIVVVPSGLEESRQANTPSADEQKMAPSEAGRKKKILVADDTAFFRIMLRDLLEGAGYQVVTAVDGEEAINKVMQAMPDLDLLLLDMMMPKADGFTVIKEIKRMEKGKILPILAVSGVFKNKEDIKIMEDLNIIGYVDKNTPADEIITIVNKILNK